MLAVASCSGWPALASDGVARCSAFGRRRLARDAGSRGGRSPRKQMIEALTMGSYQRSPCPISLARTRDISCAARAEVSSRHTGGPSATLLPGTGSCPRREVSARDRAGWGCLAPPGGECVHRPVTSWDFSTRRAQPPLRLPLDLRIVTSFRICRAPGFWWSGCPVGAA